MKKLITLPNFFLLVIFCIPFYLIKISLFDVPTNVLELFAMITIILTITQYKKQLVEELFKLPKMLIFSCVLIILGILISIFFNNNPFTGIGILKGWFIVPMFFSFTIYTTLKSDTDVKKVFASIYFSAAAVAMIAIFYKFFGITTYDNRLSAFYLSPNQLAMYLAPGIFFGLYFLLSAVLQKNTHKKILLHTALLMTIITSLYYTYSYAAWIALLFSLAITLFVQLCHSRGGGNPGSTQIFTTLSSKKLVETIPDQVRNDKFLAIKAIFITVLFLLICLPILFFSQINTEKFSALSNLSQRSSIASRATIWKVSVRLLKDNAIVGIGPGNFQPSYLAMQKYYPPYLEWAVPQPHNIFMAFWLQAGLLGFIGFLILLSFIFTTLWQQLKNKKNTALAAPLFGFFIYSTLHGLVDTTYWKNDLAFLFWICIFLLISIKNLTKITNYSHIQPPSQHLHEHD
ncbi:MAG: O-antigen ligase family protein [Candidatus Moranbacteria bacterium]|nr:O-antigen ligase family protein [Candidatus Moranbacteria bacterium]